MQPIFKAAHHHKSALPAIKHQLNHSQPLLCLTIITINHPTASNQAFTQFSCKSNHPP
jgi:hypothetical protein